MSARSVTVRVYALAKTEVRVLVDGITNANDPACEVAHEVLEELARVPRELRVACVVATHDITDINP